MNETPEPQILPQAQKSPVWGPVYSTGKASSVKSSIPPILIISAVIFVFIVSSIIFAARRPKQTIMAPLPSPTVTPSLTPIQTLSSFATQSAFVSFDQAVDQLPQTISATTITDQTLTPPTVDLSLGFQK